MDLNRELIGEIALTSLALSFHFYYPPLCTALLREFMPPLYTLCGDGFVWAFTAVVLLLWIAHVASKLHARRWP